VASALSRLPIDEQRRLLALAGIEQVEHRRRQATSESSWPSIARPEQLPPPGDWRLWLVLAGRGWGKTRTGAETIAAWARAGIAKSIAVVAQTAADGRDISAEALRHTGPDIAYEPSKRRITFPNGAGRSSSRLRTLTPCAATSSTPHGQTRSRPGAFRTAGTSSNTASGWAWRARW
jgi:hypothetical protein